jgi:hypothetical protein
MARGLNRAYPRFCMNAVAGFVAEALVWGPGYSFTAKDPKGGDISCHEVANARPGALGMIAANTSLLYSLESVLFCGWCYGCSGGSESFLRCSRSSRMRRTQQSSLFFPLSFLSAAQLRLAAFSLFLFIFPAMSPSAARSQGVAPLTLERRYQDGEAVAYKMQASNEGHVRNIRYKARVSGAVKKNVAGVFVEELAWSDLSVNGQPTALTPASEQFRETLSLAPDYSLSIPDLSQVQPILIGPITDLLAFYSDVQLAMRQKSLLKAGDHVYVKHGMPNSWADGTYVVLGQDAIDFDIALKSIDKTSRTAVLVVRHVPPKEHGIQWPAEWMDAPVSDAPNNWVEVEKSSDPSGGKYAAEVGKETFQADIAVALGSGRILSATMDNPVEVLQRDCTDRALAICGDPIRYRIRRQIAIVADDVPANDMPSKSVPK